MSNKENKSPLTINGITLKKGNTYVVTPKPDEDAPSGFRKERTTKIISPRIYDSYSIVKDSITNTWNTGFFPHSMCYRNMDEEEKNILSQAAIEQIKKPFEAIYGGKDMLTSTNDEFWDEYRVNVGIEMVFDTKDPKQFLDLYLMVLNNKLASQDDHNSEAAKKAQYCIVNKEEAISKRDARIYNKSQAMGQFHTLLLNDKKKLIDILAYLNIFIDEDTDDVAITNTVVDSYFEDKEGAEQNIELFLETVKVSNTEEGRKEMNLFRELKDLTKKGLIRREGKELYLNETNLGSSFKGAAKKVAADQELQAQMIDLLD